MKKLVLIFISVVILMGSCSKQNNDVRVLRLGYNLSVSHPFHKVMLNFQKKVKEMSLGKMKIELYPGGVIGGDRTTVELIQGGVIEMMKTGNSILESFNPVFSVFSLPYLFDNEKQFDQIMFGPIIDELNKITMHRDHFVILTAYTTGTRNFYTKKTPILKPSDLKGLKIRVMESKTQIDMMHCLGGTPTPMPFSEIYTALQQGIIDGAESNPTILTIGKQGEVAKCWSFDEHAIMPDFLIISTQIWNSFKPDQQKIIKKAAVDTAKSYRVAWDKIIEQSIEEAKTKMKVKFYYPDKKPFQKMVLPMFKKAGKNKMAAKLLDKINQEKQRISGNKENL